MSRLAERRWPLSGWYLGGPLIAIAAGVLLAWQPLALLGVAGLVVVVRFPGLAPHILLVGEGTMFLSRMAAGNYTIATVAEFAACVAALAATTIRDRNLKPALVFTASIVILIPWLIGGIASYGVAQSLTGMRLTTFPILAVALGMTMTRAAFGRLMVTGSILLVANAVAAWYEGRIGTEGLIRSGIAYGDQITEIGNRVLRAPGLMRNSFHLGLFSGCFIAVVALAVFVAGERLSRFTFVVGVPAALACLLLSTSRTSLIVVVVAALLCVQMSDANTKMGRASRISAAIVLPALPIGVILIGADSATSFFQRLGVWGTFFSSRLDLLGHGLGSVGAASFSQFSNSDRVFVDNYWLSIAFQFGGVSLLVVYLGIVLLLVAVLGRRIADPRHRAMAAVVLSIAAASMLLEVWEYPGAMAVLGLAFGHWQRSRLDAPDPSQPPGADHAGQHLTSGLLVPEQPRYRLSGASPALARSTAGHHAGIHHAGIHHVGLDPAGIDPARMREG